MTTAIDADVTLSPEPVQVPDGPDGAKAVVVQLWVRSDAGSWSGCLSNAQAEDLGRRLINAARHAGERNERLARDRRRALRRVSPD
jgi:hypothetical protein